MGLGNRPGNIPGFRPVSVELNPWRQTAVGLDLTEIAVGYFNHFGKRKITHTGKNYPIGLQMVSDELKKILLFKATYTAFASQDIFPQGMVFEDQLIKIVLDGIIRRILITQDSRSRS